MHNNVNGVARHVHYWPAMKGESFSDVTRFGAATGWIFFLWKRFAGKDGASMLAGRDSGGACKCGVAFSSLPVETNYRLRVVVTGLR